MASPDKKSFLLRVIAIEKNRANLGTKQLEAPKWEGSSPRNLFVDDTARQ